MGTHSLIKVVAANQKGTKRCFAIIYTQYDGDSVGFELAKFLEGVKIVNGLSMDDRNEVNGAGELAAKLVHFFKSSSPSGNVYLQAVESDWEELSEEFTYEVVVTELARSYQFKLTINGEAPARFAELHKQALNGEDDSDS